MQFMVDVSNPAGAPITARYIRSVVAAFQRSWSPARRRDIAVALVGRRISRRLNRIARGVDAPTDVLSFPADDGTPWPGRARQLGEIVICYPVAKRQAQEYGHSVRQEIAELLVHGLAHLAGFDHDTKAKAKTMAAFEAKVLTAAQKRGVVKRKAKNEKSKTTTQNQKLF